MRLGRQQSNFCSSLAL